MTDLELQNDTKDLQVSRMGVAERAQRSQMQLDHKRTPVLLEWSNIHYSLPIKDPDGGCCSKATIQKTILNGMTGSARPGQLVAIMVSQLIY